MRGGARRPPPAHGAPPPPTRVAAAQEAAGKHGADAADELAQKLHGGKRLWELGVSELEAVLGWRRYGSPTREPVPGMGKGASLEAAAAEEEEEAALQSAEAGASAAAGAEDVGAA